MPESQYQTALTGLSDYMDQSRIALSLASLGEDTPLVRVNQPFLDLCGYSAEEIIGENCRFLQQRADNTRARQDIRAFLANPTHLATRQTLINFKADGTPFVNLLFLSRLRDKHGRTVFIFASQFDVSRTQSTKLEAYDATLDRTLKSIGPIAADSGLVIEGTLNTIANSTSIIAQAKLMLSDLDVGKTL
ncbi:PAS domain-containing protein [Asaia astilbis]|uniref:PAS domain-containing protein n=1 Tax=Asaia astilbis TaxID=610244 RepID=UPI000471CA5C|nr:PAS domain-containing protein [Asaia astilbis]